MKEQVTRTILTGCTVHTFIHTIPLDGMIECMYVYVLYCLPDLKEPKSLKSTIQSYIKPTKYSNDSLYVTI